MVFPTFFFLSLNLAVMSQIPAMIWAWQPLPAPSVFLLTVWSFSIFCCKGYDQSGFSIDHRVMSVCRIFYMWVFCCVVGRVCLLWPVHSLGRILLAIDLLHFYSKVKFACYAVYLLTQLLQHYWLGIALAYCDTEYFSLETNRDHSVIFEIASKYCISDPFVDYDGYSISSKGFLPTIVDIMVIWVKFTHSSHRIWWSRRTCTHLLQELQNYNSLLNNNWQETVGSHQKKITHIQGQRRSPCKMVGGAKSHLESNPIPARDARRAQRNLVCTGTQRTHRDWARAVFECLLWRYRSAVGCCRVRGSGCNILGYGINPLGGGRC